MSNNNYDVIIIGGGIAGLSTALEISRANSSLEICLIESRNRLGGRLKYGDTATGKVVDLGGTWVGPLQTHITKLLEEIDVTVFPQYIKGKNIHDNGKSLAKYTGTIPNISLFSLIDVQLYLNELEAKVRAVLKLKPGEELKRARELDSISMYEFSVQQCWTEQARRLVSVVTRMILALESDQVSVYYFLVYAASAGGTRPLIDTDGGGQDSRMAGGTKKLLANILETINSTRAAAQPPLPPLRVVLDSPVQRVDYSCSGTDGRVAIQCHNADNTDGCGTYYARRLVCACPPSALGRVSFCPTPSPWKNSLWTRSRYGCMTKVIVQYPTAFWRTAGYTGQVTCDNPVVKTGVSISASKNKKDKLTGNRPITTILDLCDMHGADGEVVFPALCCFVVGDVGIQFAGLSAQDQKSAIIEHLVVLFGPDADADNVTAYDSIDWLHDPESVKYGGGCPVDVSNIGFYREHAAQLTVPLMCDSGDKVVFFAGTETAARWIGYMDGAVESSKRVTIECLASFGPAPPSPVPAGSPLEGGEDTFSGAGTGNPLIH